MPSLERHKFLFAPENRNKKFSLRNIFLIAQLSDSDNFDALLHFDT